MENFENVYASLSRVYSKLDSLMGRVYDDLRDDPTNEKNAYLLQDLGNIALDVIYSKMELVENYGDRDMKEYYLSRLNDEARTLSSSLERDRNRTR